MHEATPSRWTEFEDAEIVDWKRARAAIEHENQLTNNRFTWLLTSQGFLLAAFALLFQASTKVDVLPELRIYYRVVLTALGACGVLMALYLRLGLRAAEVQHNRVRDWWLGRRQVDPSRHPPICGSGFGWFTDKFSYYSFPLVFVAAWLALTLIVVWVDLKPYSGTAGTAGLILVAVGAILSLGYILGRRHPLSVQGPLRGLTTPTEPATTAESTVSAAQSPSSTPTESTAPTAATVPRASAGHRPRKRDPQ